MSEVILACTELTKTFKDGERRIEVFKKLCFSIEAGKKIAIIGASGAGKSTLMHLLGGLDRANKGQICLKGQDLASIGPNKRARLRNRYLGFVYQFHHLLPEFSALENVMMPMLIAKQSKKTAADKAKQVLDQVGLGDRLEHRPAQLSGGERQRAAIARAMVMNPACILADEPTGNLDEKTADAVMEMFLQLNEMYNTALILVTHDMHIAKQMDHIVELKHGELHLFSGD